MIHRSPTRRGYVLVVALGLLVLAATIMVGVGRAALRETQFVMQAQRELQRQIGSSSLRAAVLPRAESVLALAEAQQHQPIASVRERIRLGSQSFEIIVSDEQAKANVNRMLFSADANSVESRLLEALSGTGIGRYVRIHAQPRDATTADALPRFVSGIGQVFDLTRISPQQLLAKNRFGQPALDHITLWGDGRVSLKRVSEVSAKLALQPMLTTIEIRKLLDTPSRPRRAGGNPMQQMLQEIDVPTSIGGQAIPVTLGSNCHSVWVIADDGRRQWFELEVLDTSDQNRPQRAWFTW